MIDNKKARELYDQGLTDREISEKLKTVPGVVGQWRKRYRFEQNTILDDGFKADYELLDSLGYDTKQIASACDVSEKSLLRWKRSRIAIL